MWVFWTGWISGFDSTCWFSGFMLWIIVAVGDCSLLVWFVRCPCWAFTSLKFWRSSSRDARNKVQQPTVSDEVWWALWSSLDQSNNTHAHPVLNFSLMIMSLL